VSRFAEVELPVPLKHGVAEPLGLAVGHRVGAAGLGQDGACVLLLELSDFARGDAVDFDAQRDREVGLVSQDGDLVDDGAVELVLAATSASTASELRLAKSWNCRPSTGFQMPPRGSARARLPRLSVMLTWRCERSVMVSSSMEGCGSTAWLEVGAVLCIWVMAPTGREWSLSTEAGKGAWFGCLCYGRFRL
jgi:hypothetical protein